MRLRSAATVAAVVAFAACHRPAGESPSGASPALAEAASEVASDAEPVLLPARCQRTETKFGFDAGPNLTDLEIGDAVAYPGGYAVGLVHRMAAGRVAAVALLRPDPIGLTRVLDLAPTLGDAPPPRIGWRQGELVAAAYVRPQTAKSVAPDGGHPGDPTRDVAIFSIAGIGGSAADAVIAAPLSVSQRRDDSLALNLAFAGPAGLLVWDEATSAPRGVVKAAAFSKGQVGPSHDVSPPDSDAELPRVVPAGAGFFVVWIARRPEPVVGLDASAAEATGEARSYGWLETVPVDARGEATGPVRRLTPAAGHVSAYDVEAREAGDGEAAPTLFVVARDDGEAVDGSGGSLLRVRVRGDGVESPLALPTDGLGRGAPSFVSSLASPLVALAWVGKDEQARLIPLDSTGAPAGPPSAEEGLNDARPLLFLSGSAVGGPADGAGWSTQVLASTPSDPAAQLRIFSCAK